MARGLRVILYNSEEEYGATLRGAVLDFPGTKIVAEVDEAALLPQAARQFAANVLLANVDPRPEGVLPILGDVAAEHPDLAVFAVAASNDGPLILSALRLGLREFLSKPIDPKSLGEALDRVACRAAADPHQGRLIAVVGAAGGTGATTVATNVAVELAGLTTRGACLVDLDYRFGQVATLLDLDPTFSIADLCESNERAEAGLIEKALVRHRSGLSVLCRPAHFSQADYITAAQCSSVLSALVGTFDYVIVDGPTRYDPAAKAVLDLADCVLLVLELLVPDVRNIQRIFGGMRDVGFNLERIKVVCNRVGRESANVSVRDVERTLDVSVFSAIPDDWASVSTSINLGEPLSSSHPKARVRQTLRELAERLHGGPSPADDTGSRKGRLLSKIFSEA